MTTKTLQFLCTVTVDVAPAITVGETPYGIRRIIPITGGTVEGPTMRGTIAPGGADYQFIRPDGVTELVAHYVLHFEDGTYVYVINRGVRHGPPHIMEALLRGEQVPDNSYTFHTTPTFEVAQTSQYAYLNNVISVGEGIRTRDNVQLSFYIM